MTDDLLDEPFGLGAVVEDRDGYLWLSNRFDSLIEWKRPWWCCDLSEWREYRDIDVAHIHSLGVVVRGSLVSA